MTLAQIQADHQQCLQVAAELLGAPARPIALDWDLQQFVERHARFEERRGLNDQPPVMRFLTGPQGHELAAGAERYRLLVDGAPLHLVHVVCPTHRHAPDELFDFWAVSAEHFTRLYKFLRQEARRQQVHQPPLMRECDRRRLWDNTVGFLRHGCQRLRQFGVPQKRGLLLLGEPGNGKTMACRWLRTQCNQFGLGWRSVTAEEFEAARNDASAHALFELERPGIVFFDDVDMAIRTRGQYDQGQDQSTFLGGLDGLDPNFGVVYLFTSNATLADLDPAFRRPGRIDLVMHFVRPDADLRRRLVTEHWQPQMLARLNIEDVVEQTDGLSFAEIDEVKKLLVLHYLEHGEFDWTTAWSAYRLGRGDAASRISIGFHQRALVGA